MFLRRLSVFMPLLLFTVPLLAGCETAKPEVFHVKITSAQLLREHVYFTQAETSSDTTLGAIYHIDAQCNATILSTNVDKACWRDFIIALTGGASNIVGNYFYEASLEAARTAISTTISTDNSRRCAGQCKGNRK